MTLKELGEWLANEAVNPTELTFSSLKNRNRAHLIGIFLKDFQAIQFYPEDFKNRDGEPASPEAAAHIANNILKSITSGNYGA